MAKRAPAKKPAAELSAELSLRVDIDLDIDTHVDTDGDGDSESFSCAMDPTKSSNAALWLLVAFVTALHSLVFGHPRYRLPLTPVFAVYAGAAISGRVWQLCHERSGGWRLAMALCAGLAAIWVAQFVLRDWPRVQQLMEAAA